MSKIATIEMAAPEKVLTRKSSSVFGYASKLFSLDHTPPLAILAKPTHKKPNSNKNSKGGRKKSNFPLLCWRVACVK